MNGRTPRYLAITALAFVLSILIVGQVFAGAYGQIKGKITDKNTKEALIGVSVQVMGTTLGALTDLDGNYVIQRVEPGKYTLLITYIGYGKVEVTEVEVNADLTKEVNQALETSAIETKAQVVKAKRDVISKFEVSGQLSKTAEQIKSQPVQKVDDILKSVAGVKTNNAGEIFIRGGRAGEVAYILDGVPINDPLGGAGQTGANLTLVSGSIQEIQIIKDGFDPEYGNALSGIISIRSQTGNKENTKLNLRFLTDDFGNKSLNKYSRNNDNYRMILSGPDPLLTSHILPAFGINYFRDKEFTYYFYFEADQNDDYLQFWRYDTPATRRNYGYFNLLGIHVPDRLRNLYSVQSNFQFRPKQNIRAVFSYKGSDWRYSNFSWLYRYSSANVPVYTEKRNTFSFEWSHEINKDTHYEAILSVNDQERTLKPGDPDHPGLGLNPDQIRLETEYESYTDRNGNGKYDAPEPLVNIFPDSMSYGTDYNGPAYTYGEFNTTIPNQQGGGSGFPVNFRFNRNGIPDSLEGEAFVDVNGNGVWDRGDDLQDKNGNGKLDDDRISKIDNRYEEPYLDGDSVIGEPFTDLNANGKYDEGIDGFIYSTDPSFNQDLNHNGKYDGPLTIWTPGIPYYDRNGNGLYDRPNGQFDPGEPYNDVNGNGKHDQGGSSTFLSPGQHDEEMVWHRRSTKTYRAEVKGYRQAGHHELKAGFAVQRDDLSYEEIVRPYIPYIGRPDGGAYQDRGAFRDFFKYNPVSGTVYLRDKIEYGSMIASLGVRWDYFLQDTKDLEQTLINDDRGGTIFGDRQKFSPRIGFSYPISDKAKVYFNYGHFFQQPLLLYMYQRNTASADQNDVLGNPNLDYQKTIQYSFGVKYAMSETYSVDVQGYFKDEFDKINSSSVREEGSAIKIQRYRNSDYGRSRGLEVTIEKRGSGYVNGNLSYTYSFANGKSSQTNTNYLSDFLLSREPLSEAPLDNDIRHSLQSEVLIVIPNNVKPRLFGIRVINGWSLAIATVIQSGKPFTPDKSYPNLATSGTEDIERNSLRYPATAYFNVRFQKDFHLAGTDMSFNIWVDNIFDARNVEDLYVKTGRPDTDQNISGQVFGGTEYQQNPGNWNFGRQVKLGIEMNL